MFWKRKNKPPIDLEDIELLDEYFEYIKVLFGNDVFKKTQTVLPTKEFFPNEYDPTKKGAELLFGRCAMLMSVDPLAINLGFYEEVRPIQLDEGIITQSEFGETSTLGQYHQNGSGIPTIMIEEHQLSNFDELIATIVHELAHYKLLYELNLEDGDEILTDLITYAYGFGIFTANSSVIKMNTWSGQNYSGWEIHGASGYIHFKVHGFILALYAIERFENEPDWLNFLESDILKAFVAGKKYLLRKKER